MRLYLVSALILGLCLSSSSQRDKVFILESPNSEGDRKMVVTWSEDPNGDGPSYGCEIFTDQRLIEEVMQASDTDVIRRPSSVETSQLLKDCSTFSLRRRRHISRADAEEEIEMDEEEMESERSTVTTSTPEDTTMAAAGHGGWNIIFPGTKWCGAGDIAKNFDDLGIHQDTDRCCRAHDLCDDLMVAGETKNNLTNKSPFTALSCECDHTFYDCLNRINSVTSNTIGNTYFNILKRPCYAKDYPQTKKCKKYKTFLKLTCSEYERDKTAPMVYEWVKAKIYKKIPFPGPLDITLPF